MRPEALGGRQGTEATRGQAQAVGKLLDLPIPVSPVPTPLQWYGG